MSNQNDWKPLDQYNLPHDILKPGAWEIERRGIGYWTPESPVRALNMVSDGNVPLNKLRIRRPKPEDPKTPRHEERVTKWWHDAGSWVRVIQYDSDGNYWIADDAGDLSTVDSGWFIGRESADIPPEASK